MEEKKKKQATEGKGSVGKELAKPESQGMAGEAPKKVQALGPSYTAKELAGSAGDIFGTREECVLAALRAAGKETCTVPEAKGIVGRFLGKEVR